MSSLKELRLAGNEIDDAAAVALSRCTTLARLDLTGNRLTPVGMNAFGTTIGSGRGLQVLRLESMRVAPPRGQVAAGPVLRPLCVGIEATVTLQELSLAGCTLPACDLACLASALGHNRSLERLDLSRNTLGFAGCSALCHALAAHVALTDLDLSQTRVMDESGRPLAGLLLANSRLRSLRLHNARLDLAGTRQIAEAMSTNSTLERLDLSWNSISSSAVAEMLFFNSRLAVLNLERAVRRPDAPLIARAARHNHTINQLALGANGISQRMLQSIESALAWRPSCWAGILRSLGCHSSPRFEDVAGGKRRDPDEEAAIGTVPGPATAHGGPTATAAAAGAGARGGDAATQAFVAGLSAALGAQPMVPLPVLWRPMVDESDPVLVDLGPTSREFREVAGHFALTASHTMHLTNVQRVQNVHTYRRYVCCRTAIQAERCCSDGMGNEARMWHGTGSTSPKVIWRTNIDFRLSNTGFYGTGAYFSGRSEYSHAYAFRTGQPRDERQMLLCRVAQGTMHRLGPAIDRTLRRPPDGFDSIQGNLTGFSHKPDGTMSVVYRVDQAYPEYLVTYRS